MYQCHPQSVHQLPFDQGVQMANTYMDNQSSVVYVPEPIKALSDGILHQSLC